MKVMTSEEGYWVLQLDYPGYVIDRDHEYAIFLNYRALFKLAALGKRYRKTRAWIS